MTLLFPNDARRTQRELSDLRFSVGGGITSSSFMWRGGLKIAFPERALKSGEASTAIGDGNPEVLLETMLLAFWPAECARPVRAWPSGSRLLTLTIQLSSRSREIVFEISGRYGSAVCGVKNGASALFKRSRPAMTMRLRTLSGQF